MGLTVVSVAVGVVLAAAYHLLSMRLHKWSAERKFAMVPLVAIGGFIVRLAVLVGILVALGCGPRSTCSRSCLPSLSFSLFSTVCGSIAHDQTTRRAAPICRRDAAYSRRSRMAAEESGTKIVEALHELNVQTIVSIPEVGPVRLLHHQRGDLHVGIGAILSSSSSSWSPGKRRKNRSGLQTLAETLMSFATGHLTGQIGEKGKKYYYLILTLFTYIMVTNLIGLIPKPSSSSRTRPRPTST